MIQKRTIHILNGQAMYDFYQKTDFLKGETMVPFNEAMCYGVTYRDLFSQEFIEIRAKVHHVTANQYTAHTIEPLRPLFRKEFTKVALWFDADMFCQINLLTILAWLDCQDDQEDVEIHLVCERFEPVSQFTVTAEGYYSIYKQVLLEKIMPETVLPAPIRKGIELYLSYLNENSDLMQYIETHRDVPEYELVSALIDEFKEYGLGDTQYIELIESQRKKG